MSVEIKQGCALDVLRTVATESVQCCVTSPPYWGLRDYGVDGQMGQEENFEDYLAGMVEVFEEVRRVLKPDGVLWLNMGDSYSAGSNTQTSFRRDKKVCLPGNKKKAGAPAYGLAPKNLIGVPWRLAFALQAKGWYLRSDVVWSKPNAMPESVKDRPTRSHEYIFLLSRSEKYFYDQDSVRTPYSESTINRISQKSFHEQEGGPKDTKKGDRSIRKGLENLKKRIDKQSGHGRKHEGFNGRYDCQGDKPDGANLRTVWTIPTAPLKEAHFAAFPAALAERCIKAGSREGDLILDPFGGAGTTGMVADRLRREALLIELNPEYVTMSKKRIYGDAPLFAEVNL